MQTLNPFVEYVFKSRTSGLRSSVWSLHLHWGTVDNLERAKLDYIIFLVDFRSFVSQIVSQWITLEVSNLWNLKYTGYIINGYNTQCVGIIQSLRSSVVSLLPARVTWTILSVLDSSWIMDPSQIVPQWITIGCPALFLTGIDLFSDGHLRRCWFTSPITVRPTT